HDDAGMWPGIGRVRVIRVAAVTTVPAIGRHSRLYVTKRHDVPSLQMRRLSCHRTPAKASRISAAVCLDVLTFPPPPRSLRRTPGSGENGMNGALSGLRVLDFTTTIAGPHCTRLLADLGAEVIKIEAPAGDMMRTRPPMRNGASTSFGQLNAGKKSIALDLKSPAAVGAVRRLAATADVVVENLPPGVMRRIGLVYVAVNPVQAHLGLWP